MKKHPTAPENYAREAETLESLAVLMRAVAHDMNNLLMGIVGTAGLLVSDAAPDSKERKRVDLIRSSAHQARELNAQLVTFSARRESSSPELIQLSSLIEEIRLLLKIVLFKKATLRTYLEPETPSIMGCAEKIQHTVMGLLARDPDTVSRKDGSVTIRTGTLEADDQYLKNCLGGQGLAPGIYAYLEISDSRLEFEPEQWEGLFQISSSAENRIDRSGLIRVLTLVRSHQGALEVLPLGEEGITFRMIFPCAAKITGD